MLNFDPQGHDPGRVMILSESPPEEVHIYQFLHFYHKVNDFSAYPLDYKTYPSPCASYGILGSSIWVGTGGSRDPENSPL